MRRYQTLLALAIPVAIAAVMIAGRAAALVVIGVIAIGQVVLAGLLDGVTLAHLLDAGVQLRRRRADARRWRARARRPRCSTSAEACRCSSAASCRARRGRSAAAWSGSFLLTGLLVTLAVAPLAAAPGLLRTDIPGVSVAQQFSTAGLARAIGIGVAVSIAGVMLCEYLALTRLIHAVSGWRLRPIAAALGLVLIVAAPISLIDPNGFYDALLKPSLVGAMDQPDDRVRRVPAVRRQARRAGLGRVAAGCGRERAGGVRAMDGVPAREHVRASERRSLLS